MKPHTPFQGNKDPFFMGEGGELRDRRGRGGGEKGRGKGKGEGKGAM